MKHEIYTIKKIYQELKKTLSTDEAELEAKIILESILGINATDIVTHADQALTQNQVSKILEVKNIRNSKRIPLAYILEEAYFMGLKLFVNSDVLIPRPETELLVEKVLEELKARRIAKPTIIDLCTGSGCIAIALKRALPAATIYASDISKAALSVASINAKRHEVDINFVLGDYLDPFLADSYKSQISIPVINGEAPYFDVIVSNPPYIPKEDYEKLEAELKHEPKHALIGFPYKQIKRQSQTLIKNKGFLACEFGLGQETSLQEIFPDAEFYKDYADIYRIFIS